MEITGDILFTKLHLRMSSFKWFTLFLAMTYHFNNGYAQELECNIEFTIDGKGVHDFTDTMVIKNDTNVSILLTKDKIILGGQIIQVFQNVRDYPAIILAKVGNVRFLYVYPVYLDQIGPYSETLRNGIIIKITKDGKFKKIKKQFFYEKDEICTLLKKVINK